MEHSGQHIKAKGLKITAQRLLILDLFEKNRTKHLAAEDIYLLLKQAGQDVGIATIYRVLAQFEQAGLLSRRHFEANKAVYEINEGDHHDHIVCLDCGQVEEFVDPEIESLQTHVAAQRGFSVQDHSLCLFAHCTKSDCPGRQTPLPR